MCTQQSKSFQRSDQTGTVAGTGTTLEDTESEQADIRLRTMPIPHTIQKNARMSPESELDSEEEYSDSMSEDSPDIDKEEPEEESIAWYYISLICNIRSWL
jgi:hypothetical protein